MLGVLVKQNEKPVRYEFDYESYESFYPVLECDTFDIVTRKFGKNYYDVYVDDEGLLLNKTPAIFTFDNDILVEMLVGNCIILSHDKDGNTISLTEEQVNEILANIRGGVLVCEL